LIHYTLNVFSKTTKVSLSLFVIILVIKILLLILTIKRFF